MQFHSLLMVFSTCTTISLVPGPNCILALSHGAIYGKRKTLSTIYGGLIGFTLMIAVCMFGIGALFRVAPQWLNVLRIGGGLYLAGLGMKLWFSSPMKFNDDISSSESRSILMFRQGFLSAATNPKGFLLFTAVIPQLIVPQLSLAFQFTLIAFTYAFTEFCAEFFVASSAARIRPWLVKSGRYFNRVCGGVFIIFGIMLQAHS